MTEFQKLNGAYARMFREHLPREPPWRSRTARRRASCEMDAVGVLKQGDVVLTEGRSSRFSPRSQENTETHGGCLAADSWRVR